jgi:hypothetical protein
VNAGYAGQRQFVGVDLARRRSVIARMDAEGSVLACVQIDNSPAALVAEVGKAGPGAPVAIEATYGWYWAVEALQAAVDERTQGGFVRRTIVVWAAMLTVVLVGCTGAMEHTSARSGASLSGPDRATTESGAPSPSSPPSIVGTWRPAEMPGVTTGLPAGTADNDLRFFAQSWVATNGLCNHDSAGYAIGPGGAFSITTDVLNDLMLCTHKDGTEIPRLPTAERLRRARFVTIDAQFLTFTDSAGRLLAAFSRVS